MSQLINCCLILIVGVCQLSYGKLRIAEDWEGFRAVEVIFQQSDRSATFHRQRWQSYQRSILGQTIERQVVSWKQKMSFQNNAFQQDYQITLQRRRPIQLPNDNVDRYQSNSQILEVPLRTVGEANRTEIARYLVQAFSPPDRFDVSENVVTSGMYSATRGLAFFDFFFLEEGGDDRKDETASVTDVKKDQKSGQDVVKR